MKTEISIGALEKSARVWAKALGKLGLTVEIDTFRTGPGGGQHYGQSYVELTITGTYTDGEGDVQEVTSWVKFVADGYWAPSGAFSTSEGFKVAKAQATEHLMKDLKWQGWAPKGT